MEKKILINEEISRISEIMFGKSLISENFLGSLSRQAVANGIRASIEATMDDFVKKAIATGTKFSFEQAHFVIDDIIRQGGKGAMETAQTSLRVFDDVAKKAFGKSYKQLTPELQLTVKNQVRTALGDAEDDIVRSAKNAMDDLEKGTGRKKIGGPDPKPVKPDPVPIKPDPVPVKPDWWDKLKNFKYKKAVMVLIGGGVIYWLWTYLTGDEKSPFPECLRGKLSGEDTQKIMDSGKDNILIITKTGNGDIDSAGGGMFFDDGSFKSVNGNYSGKWSGEGPILVEIGSKQYSIECGGTPVPPPPPPVPGGKCKPCSSFPMSKWCKSEKIKDIQGCIGAKVDGCYGPETESKLKAKGYSTTITQAEYDKIMKECGSSTTDNTNTIVGDTETGTDV